MTLPSELPGASAQDRAHLVQATVEARLAQHLQDAASAAAEAAARASSLAAVLDDALAALSALPALPAEERTSATRATPGVAAQRAPCALMSPREREVLALVAEGRSNKSIAAALFVSPNTVKTHVGALLYKLQAGSRAQLAAVAAARGLLECGAPGAR